MTETLSRDSFSLLVSGSVHLGLALFLIASPKTVTTSILEIELFESGRPETFVPTKKIAAKVVPMMPKSSEKVVTSLVEPISSASESSDGVAETTSSAGSARELSAQEMYVRQIAQFLNARKSYPKIARQLKQQGRVMVQFLVNRQGQILEAKVIQPSPFETLNRAAQNLVAGLNGLSPFPDEIKKTTWLFTVPVDYQL